MFRYVKKDCFMVPKQIKVEEAKYLKISWDDNKEDRISLKYLREECPCANCKGETILLRTIRPPKLSLADPKMFYINNIKVVGGYAIQVSWKDGHNTGIYSWEYLKTLANDEESGKRHNYKPLI